VVGKTKLVVSIDWVFRYYILGREANVFTILGNAALFIIFPQLL